MVETHLKYNKKLDVDGYTWVGNNRKRLHVNARCGSGGVGILIKNELLNEFEHKTIDIENEGILWVTLTHKIDRFCLVLCVCYLPPENSSRQEDVFSFYDKLLAGIYQYQSLGSVCIFGDLNSRCGDLKDYIEG